MRAQVNPVWDGKLSLVLKHVQISNELDELLFLVYLVTCLIPNIPHPALIITGKRGSENYNITDDPVYHRSRCHGCYVSAIIFIRLNAFSYQELYALPGQY